MGKFADDGSTGTGRFASTPPSASDNDADTIALSQSPDSKFIVRVSCSCP
jgi:hypothetical protein